MYTAQDVHRGTRAAGRMLAHHAQNPSWSSRSGVAKADISTAERGSIHHLRSRCPAAPLHSGKWNTLRKAEASLPGRNAALSGRFIPHRWCVWNSDVVQIPVVPHNELLAIQMQTQDVRHGRLNKGYIQSHSRDRFSLRFLCCSTVRTAPSCTPVSHLVSKPRLLRVTESSSDYSLTTKSLSNRRKHFLNRSSNKNKLRACSPCLPLKHCLERL